MPVLLQNRGEKDKALQVIDYALKIMPDSVDAQQSKMLVKTNQKLALPDRPQVDTGPLSKENVFKLTAPKIEPKKELDPINEGRQRALETLAGLLFRAGRSSGSKFGKQSAWIKRVDTGNRYFNAQLIKSQQDYATSWTGD